FFCSSRRRHTRLVSDWSSDVCSSDLLALGIRYAADHGASVINLSLSTRTNSSLVAEAIHHARQRRVTIVAGAGNRSAPALDFPASEPGVIGTCATDADGVKMSASNFGTNCAISAP